jgi:hypothetical protein
MEFSKTTTVKHRHHGSFLIAVILLTTATLVSWFPSSGQAAPTPQTQSFNCRRYQETFTVPADVYSISFDIHGASDAWTSGKGARVTGAATVTPGEELEIKVGCQGVLDVSSFSGAGGYPDGGSGGGIQGNNAASGGGGSSSIVADPLTSYEVLAIAGGGGGGTSFSDGGSAGMLGDDATPGWVDLRFMDGKGATQSEGGGQTCNLANYCTGAGSYLQGGENPYGGGGGGGYYGGGAGTGDVNYWWGNSYSDYSTSGGGGSSYVSPTRSNGLTAPQFFTGWSDGEGSITLSWTVTPTTTTPSTTVATTLPQTTSTTPTTTIATSTSLATATTNVATTSSSAPTPPSTVVIASPSWTSKPETESESSVIGATPFPASGSGTVQVTDETGFTVTKARAFIPKWRTRVYIGDFKFSLKANYFVNKKKKTFSCSIPRFGTQKIQKTSNVWRWYQPAKGSVLPKDLIIQLAQRKTTMTLSGTFTRKWATSGKTSRPDKSKITTRRINLKIGAADTVTLS